MTRSLTAALLAALFAAPAGAFTVPLGADQQDVIYFGSAGPVRLRYHLLADGKAVSETWKKFIDQVFDYSDKNADGKIDKYEVNVLARLSLGAGRRQYLSTIESDAAVLLDRSAALNPPQDLFALDANKDGAVSREELYANLKRRGLGPVKVVISPPASNAQQLTDALYKHLDKDKDGRLSKEELTAAPESLAKLDQDEDEIVTSRELREIGPRNNNYYEFTTEVAISDFDAALNGGRPKIATDFYIVPDESPAVIAKQIIERCDKDKNGTLGAAELKMAKEAFARLDKDGGGTLDVGEVGAWLKGKPDVEFAAALGEVANAMGRMMKGTGGRMLAIDAQAAKGGPFEKLVRTGEDGIPRLMLPGAILSLSMRQSDGLRVAFVDQGEQVDELFKRAAGGEKSLDKKKIGETPEMRYLLGIFDAADRDGDGKLELAEAKRYFALQRAGQEVQVQVTIADQGRGLFDLIDVNHDDRLGVRELRDAWKQVAPLAPEGKALAREDLPRQFPAYVSRANITESVGGYAVLAASFADGAGPDRRGVSTQGPVWFRKMDRNADGDVSKKEFLGPPELFAKLDKDDDGLVSLSEAQEVEKGRKK